MRKFSLTRFDDVHDDEVYLYLSVLSLLCSYLNICIILEFLLLLLLLLFLSSLHILAIAVSSRIALALPSRPSALLLLLYACDTAVLNLTHSIRSSSHVDCFRFFAFGRVHVVFYLFAL